MDEDLRIKVASLRFFAVFDKIGKLQDNEGCIKWERKMINVLKMIELWTYIEQLDEPDVLVTKIAT